MFLKDLDIKDINEVPVLSLAYLGDAVFDLYIRSRLLEDSACKPFDLHKQAVSIVNASAQKEGLLKIMPLLTEREQNYVQRGRNAKSKSKPRNADMSEHNYATALEVLVGWLYVKKEYERLEYLLDIIINNEHE